MRTKVGRTREKSQEDSSVAITMRRRGWGKTERKSIGFLELVFLQPFLRATMSFFISFKVPFLTPAVFTATFLLSHPRDTRSPFARRQVFF